MRSFYPSIYTPSLHLFCFPISSPSPSLRPYSPPHVPSPPASFISGRLAPHATNASYLRRSRPYYPSSPSPPLSRISTRIHPRSFVSRCLLPRFPFLLFLPSLPRLVLIQPNPSPPRFFLPIELPSHPFTSCPSFTIPRPLPSPTPPNHSPRHLPRRRPPPPRAAPAPRPRRPRRDVEDLRGRDDGGAGAVFAVYQGEGAGDAG